MRYYAFAIYIYHLLKVCILLVYDYFIGKGVSAKKGK